MYLDYFGLSRLPFSIAPDPELLYLSPSHHEALAHLNYALTAHGGLICLTGEVGMGKTTLCRAFIDQVPEYVDIAYIFNPMLSAPELLQAICTELEIPCEAPSGDRLLSNKQLIDRLYQSLIERYANGRKVICIIDEAQSMPAPLLEQIRLLTNLETNRDKLLTLILVGQPELQDILSQHSNRQLDQRITARFHLPVMNKKQLKPYLQHRLKQAGNEDELFSNGAISAMWAGSSGIPRLINSIADRALLGAYATNQVKASKAITQQAIKEVIGKTNKQPPKNSTVKSFIGLVVIALVGMSVFFQSDLAQQKRIMVSELWGLNPYRALAQEKGLDSNSVDLDNCDSIEKNSEFACLMLDWSLAELKTLKQPLAIYNGSSWQLADAQQLTSKPQQSLILWQPIEGFESPIRPGESHGLIAWVREVLVHESVLSGWQVIAPGGAEKHDFNTYYDPILAQKVADFQLASGLKPDRIIGLKTLLALQVKSQKTLASGEEE